MTAPYYSDELVTLYLGDCREITEWLAADVLVTDPPYGIDLDTSGRRLRGATVHAPVIGDDTDFDPSLLLGVARAVIFGANNFASALPDSGAWIIWDKITANDLGVRIAEAEMAWTRGVLSRTRVFRHMWSGGYRASERGTALHPCQKPVALMAWILNLASAAGDTIADPYSGSGPVPVAAKMLGRKCIAVEIDERYCEIAAKRLDQGVLDFGASA